MIPNRYFLRSILVIIVTLGFLAGCKIGPKYERPAYALDSTYRFAKSKDTVSFADTSWTYIFKDTLLHRLIRTGLQNNFDLKIAFERVNQARASFKEARADLYPAIGISGGAEYNYAPSPAQGGTIEYHDFYATANLSWELDVWGKLRRAKESAKNQMLAQESYRQALKISLIAEIASSYFSLIELQDLLQITQYNVEIRRKSLELVQYKMIAGTVSGLVVAQAEAELAQVRSRLPQIEKALAVQENGLRLLLGELPGTQVTGDSIINQINRDIVPETGIPARLIVRRPDLIAAEHQLISANAEIGVARGKMLPTIGITASVGYSDLGMGIIGSALGNLVAPIFNMGKLKANLRRAQSVKEEMLITYQKAIYTGITEVSNGIIAYDKQKVVVDENTKLMAAAQTAYNLSDQLFNAGYASFLDVLDAQRNLYNSQTSLSLSYRDEAMSVVELYLALGGGWK